ncbi:MAG: hypothetical protein ACFBSF_04995 [Leptolyngbyaceae cyanobacterium]
MSYTALNFDEKFSFLSGHWLPKVIAEMNNYPFKLIKIEGDFIWHDHQDTDETFIIYGLIGTFIGTIGNRLIQQPRIASFMK